MSSYVIFLTKSCEAAHLIREGLSERRNGDWIGSSSGCVQQDVRIPAIYHGDKWFYAMIEFRAKEDQSAPKYNLIIC